MFKWSPFPFMRYVLYFIGGILLSPLVERSIWEIWPYVTSSFLIGFILTTTFAKNRLIPGFFGILILIYLGGLNAHLHDERNATDHFTHLSHEIKAFSGRIDGYPVETDRYFRYILNLHSVLTDEGPHDITGKIHLYLPIDPTPRLSYGDMIRVSDGVSRISPPTNPNEFNYAEYLADRNVFGQAFTEYAYIEFVKNHPANYLLKWAIGIRQSARNILDECVNGNLETQIVLALVLGVKDDLQNDLRDAYAAAGAMHILAVSGLHVGIVYLILNYLLAGLRWHKYSKWTYGILIISGLWLYALVTGLSPSVMRAATMFSVIAFRDIFSKKPNIYNSLALAALILLIYNPSFIYAVGFQLSFIAVLGIVFLFPKIYRLIEIEGVLLRKIWAITCVSIAAQLSTFPLSVYYFHQFPVYFLLTNLLVIPATAVILCLGLPTLGIGSMSLSFGKIPGLALKYLVSGMNEVVFFVDQLPLSTVDRLHLEPHEVWMLYALIVLTFFGFAYRSLMVFVMASFCFFGLSFSMGWAQYGPDSSAKIVFYDIQGKTAFDLIHGRNAQLVIDKVSQSDIATLHYNVEPYRIANGLNPVMKNLSILDRDTVAQEVGPFTLLVFNRKRILIYDQPLPRDLEVRTTISTDVLIISDKVVKSISEIPENISFSHLIISPDNSRYHSEKLKTEAESAGITAHAIAVDGSHTLDLSL